MEDRTTETGVTALNPTPELLDLHFKALEADVAARKAGAAWREAHEEEQRLSTAHRKAKLAAEVAYCAWRDAKIADRKARGQGMTATQSRPQPRQVPPRLRCEVCGCGEWATYMRPGDGCRTADDQLRMCGRRLREAK